MKDDLVKINLIKQKFKTNILGYEDDKFLRMKGEIILLHKEDFSRAIDSKKSSIRLWYVHYGHMNFD